MAIIHLRQPSRPTNLSSSSPSSIIGEPRGHRGKWSLLSDLSRFRTDFVSDLPSLNPEPKRKRRCRTFLFCCPHGLHDGCGPDAGALTVKYELHVCASAWPKKAVFILLLEGVTRGNLSLVSLSPRHGRCLPAPSDMIHHTCTKDAP